MKLTSKVKDYKQHITLWLTLFQSGAGFTIREQTILTEILLRRKELSTSVEEPFLTKLLFNSDSRKIYCNNLDITSQVFNNTLMSLKKKDVINNNLQIQTTLIPDDNLEIKFKYDN